IADMRDRSAERRQPELEEDHEHFERRARGSCFAVCDPLDLHRPEFLSAEPNSLELYPVCQCRNRIGRLSRFIARRNARRGCGRSIPGEPAGLGYECSRTAWWARLLRLWGSVS